MIVIANVFLKLETVKNLVRTLFKRRRLKARCDSQHVKASQRLVKSAWEQIYQVFPSFLGKLIWKMSPLVIGEILGVSVNTLTGDGKYPVQVSCSIYHSQFKCNYIKNENYVLNFLFHFWNLHQILNFLSHFWNLHQILKVFKEKIIVIADVFSKLQTVKNLVRTLSKRRRLRARFDSQDVKAS